MNRRIATKLFGALCLFFGHPVQANSAENDLNSIYLAILHRAFDDYYTFVDVYYIDPGVYTRVRINMESIKIQGRHFRVKRGTKAWFSILEFFNNCSIAQSDSLNSDIRWAFIFNDARNNKVSIGFEGLRKDDLRLRIAGFVGSYPASFDGCTPDRMSRLLGILNEDTGRF